MNMKPRPYYLTTLSGRRLIVRSLDEASARARIEAETEETVATCQMLCVKK